MNIIKYLLCKNSGMSNGESFLRASTNMPISGGAVRVIEKTVPFADIISITDALARPAVDLQSEITATQNLNGYEYPWVGGAGKNICPYVEPYTILANTTSPNTALASVSLEANKTYTFSCKQEGTPTSITRNRFGIAKSADMWDGTVVFGSDSYTSPTITFTPTETRTYYVFIWTQGVNADLTFSEFQTELGSTATAYVPYENICPISGRTEVNVTRTGKNLFPDAGDVIVVENKRFMYDKPIIVKGQTVTLSASDIAFGSGYTSAVVFILRQNTRAITGLTLRTTSKSATWTATEDVYGINFYATPSASTNPGVTTTYNNVQFELGSTATAYEPYEGDTFNTELGRTVYGGSLDLTTGELKITHAYVDLGDLTWTTSLSSLTPNLFGAYINNKKYGHKNFITTSYRTVKKQEMALANGEATGITKTIGEERTYIFVKDERATTPEEFTTLVTGQKMVYELATPQTISLTPTEVMMLENNNTIWADSGRVQLTYYAPKE